MTSYLAKSMHGMEILTKTLQNRIIKETFAKNRMSKALFVQKNKGYGRTDRQTDRHKDLSINYKGICFPAGRVLCQC